MYWNIHSFRNLWLFLLALSLAGCTGLISGNRYCFIYSWWFEWSEKAMHHFSGSVFSQRGADLKNLLSQRFIAGKVLNTSVKSGTNLKKKRCKNILNTLHHVIPRPWVSSKACLHLHKHTISSLSKVIVLTLHLLLICCSFYFRKISLSLFIFSMS